MVTTTFVLLLTFATNVPIYRGHQDLTALTLDPAIPADNQQKYRTIRDAKDWRNPYLIVLKDGVDVRAEGYRAVVSTSELRRVLVRLPRTAWPYGRVVAVQEMSLRAVGGVDDAPIRANVDAIAAVLKALKVRANYWPAA